MKSPARKHYEQVTAAKAAGAATPGQQQAGEQYELHAAALYDATRTLKSIKSIQAKIEKKRELLPDFLPYVEGVLSEGNGAKDDVLMTMMVWCIDVGDFEKALAIGAYAVKHNIDTPDRYARDTVSILAEEIAEGVKSAWPRKMPTPMRSPTSWPAPPPSWITTICTMRSKPSCTRPTLRPARRRRY